MDGRWEGFFHLGVVYPKLFSHANSGEGPIVETLSKLLNDPFFSAIEVTWVKNVELRMEVRDLLKISGMKILFRWNSCHSRHGNKPMQLGCQAAANIC